jgi:arsenate reductase
LRLARRGTGFPAGRINALNVLFLCEKNAELSIMAESILQSAGKDRFGSFSAGCAPAKAVNPSVVEFLAAHHLPVSGLRPKGLDAFRSPDAPKIDFIITVCDAAAAEDFSAWPGAPFIARWCIEDEPQAPRSDAALRDAFWVLLRRIKIFTSLPHGKLTRRRLEHRARVLETGYH